jgi:L-lactate dehydrogenase
MSKTGLLKVGVVGCGKVGMTAAYAMMLSGTPTEVVLIDRNKDKAYGEKLDLEQAMSLLPNYVAITGTDDYGELAGAGLVVYTAGVAQAPGQSRLDLISTNKKILEECLPKIRMAAPEAIILIVTNPVDVLTYWANKIIGSGEGKIEKTIRIFGSGTMLDTARFRFHLSEILNINPHSIHAYVLGEHGDTSFPVYANTTVGGQRLLEVSGMSEEVIAQAYQKTRDAAYKIIEMKGATYYAIGVVVTKIMQAIFSDSKTVFPLSVPLTNYQGISGVALSIPCILGMNGVEKILEVDLSEDEKEKLEVSAKTLEAYCHE